MLTPTLPGSLRHECRKEERLWLDAFFASTSNAIMDLMAEAKDLGGQAGFFGALQTWKRDLGYHPQVDSVASSGSLTPTGLPVGSLSRCYRRSSAHYVVPGGVLKEDKRKVPGQRKRQLHRRWQHVRSGPKGPYLLNAFALQSAIRMRMEQAIKEQHPDLYARIPRSVWHQSWRVDIRHVGSGREVIRYLARYVTKSAISNQQLISSDAKRVTYSYTPNSEKRSRPKTLPAHEFMQRVLQHALPGGFKRIRYYGWMHPAAKKRLEHVKLLVGKPLVYEQQPAEPKESKPAQRCRKCRGENISIERDIPPLSKFMRGIWEEITFGPELRATQAANPHQNGSRAPPTIAKKAQPTR
jgi:hypothetical protein